MLAYCLRLFSDTIALHISNEDTMFLVLGICGQAKKHWKHIEISRFKNVFEFANTFLLPGKQIFVPPECFPMLKTGKHW